MSEKIEVCRLSLTNFDESFLRMSSIWLQDPEIKRLTMSPDIDIESQKIWYNNLHRREDYLIKGVVIDNEIKIGAVGLKHIEPENNSAEYWGYIGVKEYWGKGIGSFMMKEMEDACAELGIKNLYLNVLKKNERAIYLYKKEGFVENGISDGVLSMCKLLD